MTLEFTHYGEDRERIATEDEIEIFEEILKLSAANDIELVRKSDNYVSVVIGPTDVARIKYTPRAKWIMLPYVQKDKIKLSDPEDVRDSADLILEAIDTARKING